MTTLLLPAASLPPGLVFWPLFAQSVINAARAILDDSGDSDKDREGGEG